ncbi:hypothetical protein EFY79_00650 [Hanamia caeni]|uniref:Uncharacterized protein n=1 Tax=Hanamia caeni TaxID=2294116 RepID=A0A3M9NQT4_9BACT|nr:DUF6519 domain-containing protein [Hanamia caeni]RNI39845.1 hypothetical protein EFY79_00650 [Hanamia caeni]
MKGDFSKFKSPQQIAREHFLNVFQQQGRVSLDQDWNEQSEINRYRNETSLTDVIGKSGAPVDNAGFKIEAAPTTSPPSSPVDDGVTISKGRFYVNGILCENNEESLLFQNQKDFPSASLPTTEGNYLFYLDVWLRHVTAVEENSLREVALGGPDTTTRTKVIWQVKAAQLTAPASPPDCSSANLPDEANLNSGTLSARSQLTQDPANPCGITASGGYRRLQNQLYRVEIHKGGDLSKATFKWSRDNGSVITKFLDYDLITPGELKVSSMGKDELLSFHSGDWIEIVDDTTELLNTTGILAQISKPPKNNIITIDTASIIFPESSISTISFDPGKNPRIRKWDSQGELPTLINANNGWVELEDGVEVSFAGQFFNAGDYWLIPARTAIADVEWEKDNNNNPLQLPPFGIEHHYAKLAIANFSTTTGWSITSDCRNLFPHLTELISLYYVGGDGQEAMPGKALPDTLKVGVANGGRIVSGATVKFEIVAGGGTLNPANGIVNTGPDGIAACGWTLGTDSSNLLLQVRARLQADGDVVQPDHLYVTFNASFNIAGNVAYDGGDCNNWAGDKPSNVADALTALCKRTSGGSDTRRCCFTVGDGGDFKTVMDALNKLREQPQLCICLLPGFHDVTDIDFVAKEMNLLKITGCDASIRMREKRLSLLAKKIVLHGINVIADPDNPNARIFLSSTEVSVDQCNFTSLDNELYLKECFIQIIPIIENDTKTCNVQWNENKINVGNKAEGIAIGISQGINGWITRNTIRGAMVLGYKDGDNNVGWNNDFSLQISAMLRNNEINPTGQMNIQGNVLSNIMTNSATTINNKTTYNSLIISENLFGKVISHSPDGIGNNFLAALINFINNQFVFKEVRNIVPVVGLRGIVVGNIAVNDNTQIRLFLNANIGKPDPALNLAPVS